ncbi:hypothetical protein [Prauserella endophytica]|uniref:DUF998 domain-containing protein n=1 Tax=Prauserella endophytica TaxID=1592324 RepID=A0ABY2S1A3_9PSEU|nr:hypothetical protein [Prauserella endophytica]TKG66695.1 hypothetical protein FCN18_24845 [Prauserella endophytica]
MRAERYDYWFPLALLGFGLLGAITVRPAAGFGWFAYQPGNERRYLTSVSYAEPADVEAGFHVARWSTDGWQVHVAIAGLFLATVGWYAARARKAGTPWPTTRIVAVAAGGALAVEGAYLGLTHVPKVLTDGASAAALSLPLALLGLVSLAGAYFLRGTWRRVTGVLAVVLLGVAVGAVVLPSADEAAAVIVLSAALFLLAWLHRSVLLGGVAALFLLTGGAGSAADPAALVVPAAVSLLGAMVALVLRARPSA